MKLKRNKEKKNEELCIALYNKCLIKINEATQL